MQRAIQIKLKTTPEQNTKLELLQKNVNYVRNIIATTAREKRCWNQFDLHNLVYSAIQLTPIHNGKPLGSQMTCNAIKSVSNSYRVLKIKKTQEVPQITFKPKSSVHFDKKTYSFPKNVDSPHISLYTLDGRILVPMILGDFQKDYLQRGTPKEAELICKRGQWFFNLVLDLPEVQLLPFVKKIMGVDLGENNLIATSSGMLSGGGKLRHERDCALAKRRQLQSNGSKSARQLLRHISGKEARHVTHVNHVESKKVVAEAKANGYDTIAMESLTYIRYRIRCGKKLRSRLHRWAWAQLQMFIEYKAIAAGLRVIYVNPAYTSQMCAVCGNIGSRQKHRLICKVCGVQRHSDLNSSQNIRRIAASAVAATGTVNCPNVATKKKDKRL
jgi:putative transposase